MPRRVRIICHTPPSFRNVRFSLPETTAVGHRVPLETPK